MPDQPCGESSSSWALESGFGRVEGAAAHSRNRRAAFPLLRSPEADGAAGKRGEALSANISLYQLISHSSTVPPAVDQERRSRASQAFVAGSVEAGCDSGRADAGTNSLAPSWQHSSD